VLDLLCEDLYRKPKKPYVEMVDAKGVSDEKDSMEAWTKHLIRNESMIVDLFHGQYKSTLVCSVCAHVSVTFDPFMTMSLPIPGKKKKLAFFYISYHLNADYTNYSGSVSLRESQTIADFRREFSMKYDLSDGSFLVSIVGDNLVKRLIDQGTKMENLPEGTILLYEIPPELGPRLAPREVSDKFDSNHQISPEWTKSVI